MEESNRIESNQPMPMPMLMPIALQYIIITKVNLRYRDEGWDDLEGRKCITHHHCPLSYAI